MTYASKVLQALIWGPTGSVLKKDDARVPRFSGACRTAEHIQQWGSLRRDGGESGDGPTALGAFDLGEEQSAVGVGP